MRSQLKLFSQIDEDFLQFHLANPHVFHSLVSLAYQWKNRGHERCGIGMLFEKLRWNSGMMTSGGDFKLNNNFRSRYARMIEDCNPELRGLFDTRDLRS